MERDPALLLKPAGEDVLNTKSREQSQGRANLLALTGFEQTSQTYPSPLAQHVGGRYDAAMAKKPPPRRRAASTSGPFFDLLDQMEALTITVELDWPDNIRADAQRRLNRIARALRHAPETRERFEV